MKKTLFLVIGLLLIGRTTPLFSAEKKIVSLEVKGNKAVSSAIILSSVKVKVGMAYSPALLTEDLKRLYATGQFTDVKIDLAEAEVPGGLKLAFIVKEKPVVEELIFEGNKALRTNALLKETSLAEGEVLNRKVLKDDIKKIKDLYKKKGYPEVAIEEEIDIDEATNRATIHLLIEEGARLKIKRIRVEGNEHFSDRKILRLIKTRKGTFFTSGVWRAEVFEKDKERIISFYQINGFLDVEVTEEIHYSPPPRRWLEIVLRVNEGKRYRVGKIDIAGNRIVSDEELISTLEMRSGSIYTPADLRKDSTHLQDYYFDRGYIFARARSDTVLDEESGRVDLAYTVSEGGVAYIEKIEVRGNTKTKDIVIRRELKVSPGERFDGGKIKHSKERLERLGYFEEIALDYEAGSAPERKNLVVEVKEAKTGELNFGAGYSSIDNLVGFVEIAQNNFDITNFPTFTGDGQELRVKAEFGTERRDYLLRFTEPWIFDYPLLFGFDFYQKTRERSGTAGYGYDEQRRGGDLRLGKEIGEYSRADLTYRQETIDISDIATGASADIRAEEGENKISSLYLGLTKDTREFIRRPQRIAIPKGGWKRMGTIEYAGGLLGGDRDFVKYQLSEVRYFTHFEKLILELSGRTGYVEPFDDTNQVPVYERFYAGGANTVRGYRERRIGPKDANNDPIGGRLLLVGNAEYTYPIMENLRGAVFFDTGYVWPKADDFDLSDLHSSVGVGIRLNTPIGPLRVDYGYALDPDADEDNGRFHFGVSHRF